MKELLEKILGQIKKTPSGVRACDKILYADDLCSGIEEAMSKERLDKLWSAYTNDLKSRKKEGAKEIHIATRWSVHDVIGRLENQYGGDSRAKFIVLPALDADGESNFNYTYGVGFSRHYFEDMRNNLDEASFKALFMNQPIEREGLLRTLLSVSAILRTRVLTTLSSRWRMCTAMTTTLTIVSVTTACRT